MTRAAEPRLRFKAVVLAAGLGTRMRSTLPKVMHRVLGWPMVTFPVELALAAGAEEVCVVVGHGRELVEKYLADRYDHGSPLAVTTRVQHQMLGTADAVNAARECFEDYDGAVMILSGDVPNLPQEVVAELTRVHAEGRSPVTLLTAHDPTPNQYGRIVRTADGSVARIVEFKDADEAQRALTEVNIGTYLVDAPFLRDGLARIGSANAAGEFYLTDLVQMAAEAGAPARAVVGDDIEALHGVNDRAHLARSIAYARQRRNDALMRAGVTMIDPATTTVDMDVVVGDDATIEPCVYLTGNTTIGRGCTIELGCRIDSVDVPPGDRVRAFSRLGPG